MIELEAKPWTITDAKELYDIARWGNGYFGINELGHVTVHPDKDPSRSIDLKQLIDHLQLRGIDLPILIRFAEILKPQTGFPSFGRLLVTTGTTRLPKNVFVRYLSVLVEGDCPRPGCLPVRPRRCRILVRCDRPATVRNTIGCASFDRAHLE